jgi:hypothetical protein
LVNSSLLAEKVTIATQGNRLTCNEGTNKSTEKSAKTAGLEVSSKYLPDISYTCYTFSVTHFSD